MMFTGVGKAEGDPEFLAMEAVISSGASMDAAFKATAADLPAIAGVDAMLTALFVRYAAQAPYTLANAGFILARHMRKNGYVEIGKGKCPLGCSVQTGAMFTLENPVAVPSNSN